MLIETANFASTLTNVRIEKLSGDIAKNNEKLIWLSQEVIDVQVSIDTSQQIVEEKLKELKQKFEKREKRTLTSSRILKLKAKTLKKYYEDRLRGDNLHFDGIAKHENELWSDVEEQLQDFLYQMLNTQRVGKECIRIIGKPKVDGPRTIFAKFINSNLSNWYLLGRF